MVQYVNAVEGSRRFDKEPFQLISFLLKWKEELSFVRSMQVPFYPGEQLLLWSLRIGVVELKPLPLHLLTIRKLLLTSKWKLVCQVWGKKGKESILTFLMWRSSSFPREKRKYIKKSVLGGVKISRKNTILETASMEVLI